jgi:hypothetical protein
MSKLSTIIAATLLIAAGAASAQTTTPLTREQVVAELIAARDSGELAAIQGEKGVEAAAPVNAGAVATVKLPRQAVLNVKPTDVQLDNRTAAALAADHGENAQRELGNFVPATIQRAPALASR